MVKRYDFGARDADGSTPLYVRASDYDALAEGKRVYEELYDTAQARIRELGAALRDLLALADISQPLPDLVPGVILRARATLDRGGEHG